MSKITNHPFENKCEDETNHRSMVAGIDSTSVGLWKILNNQVILDKKLDVIHEQLKDIQKWQK